MRKAIIAVKILAGILIIALFICFLATLYVGVDPNSRLSDNLRQVPGLNIILRDRIPPQVGSPQPPTQPKRRIIYKNIGTTESQQVPQLKDMEVLLKDTDLYSEPSEGKKLEEKVPETGRYPVVKRNGEWAAVKVGESVKWISPKRKSLSYYQMSEEMRRVITGEGDILDFPPSTWYERLIGSRLKEILAKSKNLRKSETDVATLYCDDKCSKSAMEVSALLESLRAEYIALFSGSIKTYEEVLRPVIILKSGLGGGILIRSGDYSLGIIKEEFFDVDSDISINILFHEYTHHLNRIILRLGGRYLAPRWIDEGLAEYFSCMDKSVYLSEKYGPENPKRIVYEKTEIEEVPGIGMQRTRFLIKLRPVLKIKSLYLKDLYQNSKQVPYDKLFSDDYWKQKKFDSSEERALYATSWATISFCLEGNEGSHREAFFRYLKDIIENNGQQGDLISYLGFKDADALAQNVRDMAISRDYFKYE